MHVGVDEAGQQYFVVTEAQFRRGIELDVVRRDRDDPPAPHADRGRLFPVGPYDPAGPNHEI